MEIVCRKCQNKWDYKGNARRVSCSKCRTSIMIDNHKIEGAVSKIVKLGTFKDSVTLQPPLTNKDMHEVVNVAAAEVKFPKSLWKDARLSQRFYQIMKGDPEYVVLKVDDNGLLSL